MRSEADIQNLVSRLLIGAAVVGIGLYLGRTVSVNTVMAGAVVALAFLIYLLVTRPHYFTLLLLFFMFEAFALVDVDTFGRLPGLFRAKDALLFLLLAYTMATAALGEEPLRNARKSSLFKPLVIFLFFVALQMARTRFLMGERFMLLFRAGRHFLSYGMALFLIIYLRDAKRWRLLMRFCYFFVAMMLVMHLLGLAGIRIPKLGIDVAQSIWGHGVVKFVNPAMCLAFWLFQQAFWAYCFRPAPRAGLKLAWLTLAVTMYSYRALWGGLIFGMALAWFLVPRRVRARSAVLMIVAAVSVISLGLLALFISSQVDAASAMQSLFRYITSTVSDVVNVEGSYYSRSMVDAQRIPLIKAHPFMGMGFVSVFGEVALDLWMQGNLPVGTIDTGWVDLLLKLGGVGVIVLAVLFIYIVRTNRRLLRAQTLLQEQAGIQSWMLANIGYIALVSVSLVAAALPSWEPGIATLAIIIAQTMRFELDAAAPATDNTAQPARAPAKIAVPVS